MLQNVLSQKVVVLSANRWDFVDEKTNEKRSGTTITYIPSLSPYVDEKGTMKGYKTAKATMPHDIFIKIHDVPGHYTMSFQLRATKDGKMEVTPIDLEYVPTSSTGGVSKRVTQ